MRVAAFLALAGSALAEEKPRIFITESVTAEIVADNLAVRKGTSPENVEVMKAFLKHCPALTVTSNRDKADFVIRFDREPPSPITPFVKGNKVAVFDRGEDLVYSDSGRYLTRVVRNACTALTARSGASR
jgi:hypothetical protein